ncbi:MAG: type II toxin-antitoxin system YafQ family toxin [Aminivibrio sp.]|nr:YafQ family addiction module toxin [Synergistaceae bacterium]
MLELAWSKRFKKDYARAVAQCRDLSKLDKLLVLLVNETPLPSSYKDHALKGEWSHYRDAHIEFDWILIYRVDKENQRVLLAALGSHSEIF